MSATLTLTATADMDGKTLTAHFRQITVGTWNLTISSTVGGSTDSSGSIDVPDGQSFTIQATADSSYTFNYWLFDGNTYSGNTIVVPDQVDGTSHTLQAVFSLTNHNSAVALLIIAGIAALALA